MIVRLIHRTESAFRFYLDDTLDRFQYHLEHGEFPDDDAREEERLEIYEMLTDEQRQTVWGLSADLYSLIDKEQSPTDDPVLGKEQIAAGLETAYSDGDWNELLRLLRHQDGLMPSSVVDYMRCRAWTELGYPEVALAFIKNAVRLDPRDSGYKHLALELLKKMKDWDALAELAREYVTANPDDGGVLLAAGESFHDLAIQHGDPSYDERAVQYLTYGLQHTDSLETRDSQTVSGVVTLAFAMLNLGNADHAIRLLDDWVQIHSQNPELHTARGIVHLTVDYDAAIQNFKRAVRLQTKSVLPYLEYANFQIHAGQYDDAIDTTETGMLFAKRDNDLAKLNHLQAIACAFADQLKKAIHLMSKAKKLDPTDQTLAANLKVMTQLGSELGQSKSALKLPAKKTRLAYDLLRQIAA